MCAPQVLVKSADIKAIYRAAIAQQLPATEPIVSNSMWFTALADPDGYQLAFESNTVVPEGTKLSVVH